MLFKSKINLALQVLHHLKQASDALDTLTVAQLAKKTSKSASFIEQIMVPLVAMGLVDSRRGPGGGYLLSINTNGGGYRYRMKSLEAFAVSFYPDEGYDEHLAGDFAMIRLAGVVR